MLRIFTTPKGFSMPRTDDNQATPTPQRRRRLWLLVGALAVVGTLAACSDADKDTHPSQVLTQRKAVFKQFTRTLEPMALVANGRNPYQQAEFLGWAQDLAALAPKPWPLFTPDGNYPPTRARAAVWSEPLKFKAAQESYQAAVKQLVAAAQVGTLDAVTPAVADVASQCKACHKQFRSE